LSNFYDIFLVYSGKLKLDLIDNDSIINLQNIPLDEEGIGNANFTNGESFTIDRTPPQVTSMIRASNNPTIDSTINYIVTFPEPVVNVDASDFFVTTSNLNSFATNIQNQNPFYIVAVSTGAGSGNLRLDLVNNNSIADLAGNILNQHFTNGESFSIAKPPVNFDAPNLFTKRIVSLKTNPSGVKYPSPTLFAMKCRAGLISKIFADIATPYIRSLFF
jgi:hypothetical protein